MNLPLILALSLAATPAAPPSPATERSFRLASELAAWCREEAEAAVVARGQTPYQWRASHHERGNTLHVEGKLRVDGEDLAVACRVARGARERYAVLEFPAAGG